LAESCELDVLPTAFLHPKCYGKAKIASHNEERGVNKTSTSERVGKGIGNHEEWISGVSHIREK